MVGSIISGYLAIFLAVFWTECLPAATIKIAGTVGLMQQPTSHYYHGIIGLQLEGVFKNGDILVQGDVFGRPVHKMGSFEEQEFGYLLLIGHNVLQTKYQTVSAYGGIGRMFGKLSSIDDSKRPIKRSYAMTGPSFSAKYELRYLSSGIGLSHTTIIGYRDLDQLKAYVVWPFNFFTLHLGWRL